MAERTAIMDRISREQNRYRGTGTVKANGSRAHIVESSLKRSSRDIPGGVDR